MSVSRFCPRSGRGHELVKVGCALADGDVFTFIQTPSSLSQQFVVLNSHRSASARGEFREHSATAERVESTESDQFRGLLHLREGHENRARTTPYAL